MNTELNAAIFIAVALMTSIGIKAEMRVGIEAFQYWHIIQRKELNAGRGPYAPDCAKTLPRHVAYCPIDDWRIDSSNRQKALDKGNLARQGELKRDTLRHKSAHFTGLPHEVYSGLFAIHTVKSRGTRMINKISASPLAERRAIAIIFFPGFKVEVAMRGIGICIMNGKVISLPIV